MCLLILIENGFFTRKKTLKPRSTGTARYKVCFLSSGPTLQSI